MKYLLCFFTAMILLVSCITSLPRKTDRLNAKITKLLKKAGWTVSTSGGDNLSLPYQIDGGVIPDSTLPDCSYCGTGTYTEKGDSLYPVQWDTLHVLNPDNFVISDSTVPYPYTILGDWIDISFFASDSSGKNTITRNSAGQWIIIGSLDSALEVFYQGYKTLSDRSDSLQNEIYKRDRRINRLLNL